jgi:hypothetical protein
MYKERSQSGSNATGIIAVDPARLRVDVVLIFSLIFNRLLECFK